MFWRDLLEARMALRLTFLGAAGTVTGSKYLVEIGSCRLLVDCGLFQGLKRLRERNWQPPPVNPKELDAVILTHAHIDHTGYLPVLARKGFRGPVYSTAATSELISILLPDSAEEHFQSCRLYAARCMDEKCTQSTGARVRNPR